MKRFTVEEEAAEEPPVNLTPLIDVVFVVLISFMLIAPMLEIDGVDLAVGTSHGKKRGSAPSLAIAVKKDNGIWMDGKQYALDTLEHALRAEHKKHPHAIPQVIHDRNASFGTYQSLKVLLERCGFEQMEIVVKPE